MEKRLTRKETEDVFHAIEWDDWIDEERFGLVLGVIGIVWTCAHDERVEFEDAPGAITKAQAQQLVRDVRAGARIVVDTERRGPIRVHYADGSIRSLTAGRMRRRDTPATWLP